MSAPATSHPSEESATSGRASARTRFRRWRYRARQANLGSMVALLVAVFVLGFLGGRWTAPPDVPVARQMLEDHVLPLALDADGIWTSASVGAPPVSEALVALQRDEDPSAVLDAWQGWLASYDEMLVRIAALDLPSEARPVQRQFIAAITLSRDAVEVLGRAARIQDPERRQGLLTEVGRLRVRGEQLTQSARTSILDVDGHGGEVTPLPGLPPFPEVPPPPAGD